MACNLLIFIASAVLIAHTNLTSVAEDCRGLFSSQRAGAVLVSRVVFAWHRPTIENYDRMQQQINLFQPIFRKERKILSFGALIQISGIVMFALAVLYGYGLWNNNRASKQLSALKTQHDERIAMLERVSREASKHAGDVNVDEEVARLEAELAAQRYVVTLLNKGRVGTEKTVNSGGQTGFSQYLEIFSRRVVKGMWISQFSVYDGGENMLIKGGALSAALLPEFLTGLSEEPLLVGMEFSILQMSRDEAHKNWIEFVLSSKELPESTKK